MRSRLRSSVSRSRKVSFACLGVFLFIVSTLPSTGAAGPAAVDGIVDGTDTSGPSAAAVAAVAAAAAPPGADASLADLALATEDRVAELGGSTKVAPDGLPGYDGLTEAEQRALWRGWLLDAQTAAAHRPVFAARDRAPVVPAPVWATAPAAGTEDPQEGAAADDLADLAERQPFGLKPVWSLEVHGQPREVVPLAADGAHLLVTQRSVLRFDAPGAQPSWMLKPGVVRMAEAHDVNDDQVVDMLVLVYPFTPADDAPTVYVFDGRDGAVLHASFAGEDSFYDLTTGDVDGDGVVDLVGVTMQGRLIAAQLDGTIISEVSLPSGVTFNDPVPFVTLASYYTPRHELALADVDGDGAKDFIVTDRGRALLDVLIQSASVRTETIRAYSSDDGRLLWEQVAAPEPGSRWSWGWSWVIDVGDVDRDGREDVAMWVDEYESQTFLARMRSGYEVRSGADGSVLVAGGYEQVCSLTCMPSAALMVRGPDAGWPFMIMDFDGDGEEELLLIDEEHETEGPEHMAARSADAAEGPVRERLVLRGVVPGPNGEYSAAEELYRVSFEVPYLSGGSDSFHLRDIDGDGLDEILVYLTGLVETEDGEVGALVNELLIIRATAAESVPLAQSFAFWDYDALNGQAYGLTWDDRWVPVDADGRRIGTGTRLLTGFDVRHQLDQNADGIDDLLIRLGSAVAWVDGSTGSLFRIHERPLGTYVTDVVKENGRLRLFERSYAHDTQSLVDMDSGVVLWTVDIQALREERGRNHSVSVYGLTDFEGDGAYEPLIQTYDWRSRSRTFDVVDGDTGLVLWSLALNEEDQHHRVYFFEALTGHPGHEVMIERSSDDGRLVELWSFTGDTPFWSLDLGESGRVRSHATGHMLVVREQTGLVLERIGLQDGVVTHSYPLPKDAALEQAFVFDYDRDGHDELVVSYVMHDGADESDLGAQMAVFYDLERETEDATFRLADGEVYTVTYTYNDGFGTSTYTYNFHTASYVAAPVGDYDGDGVEDFAYREAGRLTVRSTQGGGFLALAPSDGRLVHTADMNADGKREVGVYTADGRVRLMRSVDASVEVDEDVQTVRRIDTPTDNTIEDEDFVAAVHEKGVPAAGVTLVLLSMLGLVAVARRRRD